MVANIGRLDMRTAYRVASAGEPSRVYRILLETASPTGLNRVVRYALAKGILAVSSDKVLSAPGALPVNPDGFQFGRKPPRRLLRALHGEGNVITLVGPAGPLGGLVGEPGRALCTFINGAQPGQIDHLSAIQRPA